MHGALTKQNVLSKWTHWLLVVFSKPLRSGLLTAERNQPVKKYCLQLDKFTIPFPYSPSLHRLDQAPQCSIDLDFMVFRTQKNHYLYISQCLPSQGRVFFLFSELDLAAVLEPCWCNASTISGQPDFRLEVKVFMYAVTVCGLWGAWVSSPVFPRGEGKAPRRLTSFPRKSPWSLKAPGY